MMFVQSVFYQKNRTEFFLFSCKVIRVNSNASSLLTTHGLPVRRAASADLATSSAAADAGLGNVRAADVAKINSPSLQKKCVCFFFGFLRHT